MAALITAVVAFILSWLIVGALIAPVALVLASQASKQEQLAGQFSGRRLLISARILAWAAIAVCALGILGLIMAHEEHVNSFTLDCPSERGLQIAPPPSRLW
jgi:hypothetical protein